MRISDIETQDNLSEFNNWVIPTEEDLEREYVVEYEKKRLDALIGYPWDDVEDFITHANNSEVITVSDSLDRTIEYRSRTNSFEELHDLIKTYRSYGTHRTEQTLLDIYEGFRNNKPMKLPIVLNLGNNRRRVFSGNTRMDVAFQLGVVVKVLEIKL